MIENFSKEELNNEQWRDIDGYDGVYQVSDLGRVRSKKYGDWRVLKGGSTPQGYRTVPLYKDNKVKTFYVHRLVANAFIPNDDETKTIINHKNEIPSQNFVDNLEWCDRQYNNTYNDIHHRRKRTKQIYQPVRSKVKNLYNPELSVAENIELFKDNGLYCSRPTMVKLRKDLGITKQITKIDKVKRLYRPDLSIDDNIKLFKEQGIECSRNTVLKLRQYLGITRHYRPRKKTN